jgi:predicted aminopeptidase
MKKRAEYGHWSVQPCGKRGHPSRASARAQAIELRQQGDHVRVYFHVACGTYHVGHLPAAVMRGEVSDVDYYDE